MTYKYNPIPIFYYHSIAPERDNRWCNSFLTFKARYLEDLLCYLRRRRYHFISLDEYFELRRDPTAGRKRIICLTFDDGYLDNYIYLYPLLSRYKARGTIFVSPLFIEEREDLRTGHRKSGFASWNELLHMQQSGVIDIESHTMTHTRYTASGKLTGFHHPGARPIYTIVNRYPEKAPYYPGDNTFFQLIPYGTPLFEEGSAVVTRRVAINEDFEKECVEALSGYDWSNYDFNDCLARVEHILGRYRSDGNLVMNTESDEAYRKRLHYEIAGSKELIEQKLGKPVNHICWPHGDYNELCHKLAREAGYHSSNIVLLPGELNHYDDRFDRTGSGAVANSRLFTLLKARYKIGLYRKDFPWYQIGKAYSTLKYGKKKSITGNSM